MKVRLDKLVFERRLAFSRERAQALILAGRVLVNEQKIDKAGAAVETDVSLRVLGDDPPFVSRGGLKLAHALVYWHLTVQGLTCLDIGASTGGFTDCLLQNGAAKVLAVDTGYGQMDAMLRSHPRVRLLEKTNARYLTPQQLWPEGNPEPIGLIAVDVSFISATLVLPAVLECARWSAARGGFQLILLVKPQFEVGRKQVGRGGIVRDPASHQAAVHKVEHSVEQLGGSGIEVIESPILGTEGNREFLLHARFA